jgi:hypothetical protein
LKCGRVALAAEMNRLVAAVLLVAVLALAIASAWRVVSTHSTGDTEGLSHAVGLQEQIDELVLGESDVPPGFHTLLSTDMDPFLDFLEQPIPEGTAAYMSMLLDPDTKEMIYSMVILMQDEGAVEECFSKKHDVNIEKMDEAFNMMSDDQRLGQTRLDTRDLDVSALGEQAYGLGTTTEMPDAVILDQEVVFFGKGSVVGMIVTAAVDDTAAHAVPLAQTMAEKIEAALQ